MDSDSTNTSSRSGSALNSEVVAETVSDMADQLDERNPRFEEPTGSQPNRAESLSPEQTKAYKDICNRLDNGERFIGLRGYAGSGKTYLTGTIVEHLVEDKGEDVVVCAPTHKAVRVLDDEVRSTDVPLDTIHSFLGLQLEPTSDGSRELVAPEEQDFSEGVVIVDEASMIGTEEWEHIKETPMWIQWLFVGDPAQLPPVEEKDSPALQVPGPTLTTVHRQAKDNPILSLATDIREETTGTIQSAFEDGKGVGVTDNGEEFMDSIVRAFDEPAYEHNPTHARVLAYRNKTVRAYNEEIRKRRYGKDAPRFVEGEWVVARDTWFHEGAPRIINSEEVKVIGADVGDFTAKDESEWKVWKLEVETPPEFGAERKVISVLHESDRERYENALKKRKEKAEEDGSRQKWKRYYDLFERFARVDYAYASTVHRSQGSTYGTVFVDHRDLRRCRPRERTPLFYVATTRPSTRLALLTDKTSGS